MENINIFAALLTGVASLALGFVWYGPLFAKIWMKEVGLKEETMKGNPVVGYLIAFLTSCVLGAATSYIIHITNTTSLVNGILIGLLLGIGFVGTTFATNYIFAKRTLRLYSIDAGYQILLVVIAGIICTLLR